MAPRSTSVPVSVPAVILAALLSVSYLLAPVLPATAGTPQPVRPAETQLVWFGLAGNWNNTTHWVPGFVPDAPDEFAWIQGGGGTYNIDLDISPSLFKMQLNDTTVTLRLNGNSITVNSGPLVNEGIISANTGSSALNGAIANTATGDINITGGVTLSLGGPTFANDGLLQVNTTATSTVTTLSFSGNTTVGGSGTFDLLRQDPYSEVATGAGALLTQQSGHHITGRGRITAALDNSGEVRADVSGWPLYLMTNAKTNHNLMRATGGGKLEITGITLDNTGGVVRADGGTVTLDAGTTIQGGTLERTGTSEEVATGAVTLRDLTHNGYYDITSGTTTTVRGASFVNSGTIEVNYDAVVSPTALSFADTTTLTGGGTVYMPRPNTDSQLTTGAGGLLTQAAGHTIHGRGQIHAALVNNGEVNADISGWPLFLMTNGKANHNLMRSTGGGKLEITGITLDNTGGVVRADGGTVTLDVGTTIQGGTLERTGTSEEVATGAVTLRDVTHNGYYDITGGTTTTVRGAAFVNSGTIEVNYTGTSSPTVLSFPDTTTLTGGGTVYMPRPNTDSQLTTGAGGLLTQAAGHTIHGRGQIHAALVNNGEVNADISGWPLFLMTNGKANHNLMRTTGGGQLEISNITLDNTGGVVRAEAGTVTLDAGTTIQGGTLERTGTSEEVATGAVTLRDVTHNGYYDISSGTTTTVRGPNFVNNGTIEVNYNSAAASTFLSVGDSASLVGTGTVYMPRPNGDSQIKTATPGAILTQGAGHTIHGRGQIHPRTVNAGTIRADISGYALTMDSTVTNTGAIEASGNGTMTLSKTPTNWSADSTLAGGAWRATSATLRVTGVIVAKNAAEILLDGTTSQFYRDAGTTNALTPFRLNDTAGSFTIRNGRDFSTASAFTNRGALRVESATSAFTVAAGQPFLQTSGSTTLATGGTLTATGGVEIRSGTLGGVGTVAANTLVSGDTAPTGGHAAPGASAGQLNITGTYTQTANATLEIELGGTGAGQSDLLNISGAASLNGTLALTTLLATYAPQQGDTIRILRCASRTGVFSSVTGTNPYPGITLAPVYSDTTVKIVVNGIITSVPGIGSPSDPGPGSPGGSGAPLPTQVAFTSRVGAGAGGATFELALPEAADVRVTLFDARGRRLATLVDAALPAGRRTIDSAPAGADAALQSGLYFARAEIRAASGSTVRVARAVVVR